MKFGQLILRKIIKIVATRCQILKLKYTNIDLAGELITLPRSSSCNKGNLLLRAEE